MSNTGFSIQEIPNISNEAALLQISFVREILHMSKANKTCRIMRKHQEHRLTTVTVSASRQLYAALAKFQIVMKKNSIHNSGTNFGGCVL